MMVPLPITSKFDAIFEADPKTGAPEAARFDALNEAIAVYEGQQRSRRLMASETFQRSKSCGVILRTAFADHSA